PLAFLQRANIAIKFGEMILGRRTSQVLDALASVAVEVAILLIAWRLYRYAAQAVEAGDVTFMLRVRIGPFWLFAATMMAATTVVQAVVVVLEVARCFGHGTAAPRAEQA